MPLLVFWNFPPRPEFQIFVLFSFQVFRELKCSIVKAMKLVRGNDMLIFVCVNEIITRKRDALI